MSSPISAKVELRIETRGFLMFSGGTVMANHMNGFSIKCNSRMKWVSNFAK